MHSLTDYAKGWWIAGANQKDHYFNGDFSESDKIRPLCNRKIEDIWCKSELEDDDNMCKLCTKRLYDVDPNKFFWSTILWTSYHEFEKIKSDNKLMHYFMRREINNINYKIGYLK